MTANQGEEEQTPIESSFLHIGGSVGVGEACYIERKADQDLYESLKRRECCCIFNSRQMGKSSLRVHMIDKLQHEGFYCATIDPQNIGVSCSTQEQWYGSVATSLIDDFGLDDRFDLDDWISEHQHLSPIAWLDAVLGKVLLTEISAPIVIFVEEIDRLRSLSFSIDDFFLLIRSCYERRAVDAKYNRLNFVLIGVTTPRDLIRSNDHSNFNIGREIELTGFRLDEAGAFLHGMRGLVADPKAVLSEVLSWTGGQPFLTQKLLGLTLQNLDHAALTNSGNLAEQISKIVQVKVIDNWESQDQPEHLRTLQDRILQIDEGDKGVLLSIYKQILENGSIVSDDNDDEIRLRLTGLVVKDKGKLWIYNPIYKRVFDLKWAENALASLRPKLYAEVFRRWHENKGQTNSSSFVLTGDALKEAQNWFEGKRLSLDDQNFLAQSQKAQEKLTTSRLMLLTLGCFAGLSLAVTSAFFLNLLRSHAVHQETAADIRRLIGESRRSQERGYPDEALESAIRAVGKLKNSNDALLTTEANLNLAHLTSIYRPRLCRWSANPTNPTNPNASGPIWSTALAPWNDSKNNLIASAAENQDPLVWKYDIDIKARSCSIEPIPLLVMPKQDINPKLTRSLVFSQDGRRLAGIIYSGRYVNIRVWGLEDYRQGRLMLDIQRDRPSGERWPRFLAITPDNAFLAMGTNVGQEIEVINMSSKATALVFKEKVTSISVRPSLLPRPNQLAWSNEDGVVKTQNIPSGQIQHRYKTGIAIRPLVAYSRGGRYLAVSGTCMVAAESSPKGKISGESKEKEFISIYDLSADQERPSIYNNERLNDLLAKPLSCRDTPFFFNINTITFLVKDVDISSGIDKPILATTRRDGTIRLWSVAKHNRGPRKLLVLTDLINAGKGRDNTNSPNVRVSSNGEFYITTNVRNMISIRAPLSGSPDLLGEEHPYFYDLSPAQSGDNLINSISFSDDSKYMALEFTGTSNLVKILPLPVSKFSKPYDVVIGNLPLTGWKFDQKSRKIQPGGYFRYNKNFNSNELGNRLDNLGISTENLNKLLFFNKNSRRYMIGPFLSENDKSILKNNQSVTGQNSSAQDLQIISLIDKNPRLSLSLPDIMDGPIRSFKDSAISQDGKMLLTANDDGTVGIWNIQLNDKKTAADAREFLPISLDNMPLVALASANVNPGHGGDQWFAVAYENKNVRIFRLSEGLKKSACDKLAQTYSTDQSVDSPRLGRRWQQLNAEKICSSSKVAGPTSGLMQFLGRLVPGFFK